MTAANRNDPARPATRNNALEDDTTNHQEEEQMQELEFHSLAGAAPSSTLRRRQLQDQVPEEVCYNIETLQTEYNPDTFIDPCTGMMFYFSSREKPIIVTTLEVDIRDDLANGDLHVEVYTTVDDQFYKGLFRDGKYWGKVADTTLIQHPDPTQSHRYLIPSYDFAPIRMNAKARHTLYVRMNGQFIDLTTNNFVQVNEIGESGSNLHVHAGYCIPNNAALWPFKLNEDRAPIFAGKFYTDVESTFCDFTPTTETAIEFVYVLDSNGAGLEFSNLEEDIDVFAQDMILDDTRLVDYIAEHELKISPKKSARAFFRRYEGDCPDEWIFCEAFVAKIFYEHLETLTPSELRAQIYKHEPYMAEMVVNYLPSTQRIHRAGLTGEQASFQIRLQNTAPRQLDTVQLNFLYSELLSFFKEEIPAEKAVVYDMRVTEQSVLSGRRGLRGGATRSLGPGDELLLDGYFEGARTDLEEGKDFAERIDSTLQEKGDKFLSYMKFELGLPGYDMEVEGRHENFVDLSYVGISIDPSFSRPIVWVKGRGRAEEPEEASGGLPPWATQAGIGAGVCLVLAVIFFCFLRCFFRARDRRMKKRKEEHMLEHPHSKEMEPEQSPYLEDGMETSEDKPDAASATRALPTSVDETCDNMTSDGSDESPRPADPTRPAPPNVLMPQDSDPRLLATSGGSVMSEEEDSSASSDSSSSNGAPVVQAIKDSEAPPSPMDSVGGSTYQEYDAEATVESEQPSSKDENKVYYSPPGAESLSSEAAPSRPNREGASLYPGATAAVVGGSSWSVKSDRVNAYDEVPSGSLSNDNPVGSSSFRKHKELPSLPPQYSSPKPKYTMLELRKMSIKNLKGVMQENEIQYSPRQVVEKDDIIRLLVLSEKVEIDSELVDVERTFSQRRLMLIEDSDDEDEESVSPTSPDQQQPVDLAELAAHAHANRVRIMSFDGSNHSYKAPTSSISKLSRQAPKRVKSADATMGYGASSSPSTASAEKSPSSHHSSKKKKKSKEKTERKKPTRTRSSDVLGKHNSSEHSRKSSTKSPHSSSKKEKHRKTPGRNNSADDILLATANAASDLWDDEPESDVEKHKKKSSKSKKSSSSHHRRSEHGERKKVKRSKSFDATGSSSRHSRKKRDKSIERKAPGRSQSSDAILDKKKKKKKSSSSHESSSTDDFLLGRSEHSVDSFANEEVSPEDEFENEIFGDT